MASTQPIRDVASQLFWLIATLEVILSVGFAVLVGKVPTLKLTPSHFSLARSQRKDNWMACAVIWTVVFSEGCPVRTLLWVAGAMILAWLIQRTLYRVRSLQGHADKGQGTKR